MSIMKFLSQALLLLTFFFTSITQISGQEGQDLYSHEHKDMLPELSAIGEHAVGVKTLMAVDQDYVDPFDGSANPRSLKLEIWYPTEDTTGADAIYTNQTRNGTKFSINANALRDAQAADLSDVSVVIISHGYTGYRTIMYYLGEHLASHGYLVVSIDHTDSTNEDVDPKVNPFSGFRSTLINRSRDQQFVLDYISDGRIAQEIFGNSVGIKNAGLIGYSMGGYGAISTVGGCYDFSDDFTKRMIFSVDEEKIKAAQAVFNTCAGGQSPDSYKVDERWKAMIAFAPWGGRDGVISEASINTIKVPSLYISGNQDDVSGYEGIKNQFQQTTSTDSYLLTYVNARHNIAPHPAPQEAWTSEYDFGHYYEPAWSSQTLNRINQHFALAMMDCYLSDDEDACTYLDLPMSSDQPPEGRQLSAPWKGFDHRYGTGMTWDMKKVED